MKALIDRIAEMQDKRARYWRTVQELKAMSIDVALDLDIDRADAEKIAYEAVYGADQKPAGNLHYGHWKPAIA